MKKRATALRLLGCSVLVTATGLSACSDDGEGAGVPAGGEPSHDAGSTPGASSGNLGASSGASPDADASPPADARASSDAALALPECGDRAVVANPWIATEFSGLTPVTGTFTKRQFVELPAIVKDATSSHVKYAFDFDEAQSPTDPRVALVNVRVTDLESTDGFGGAIQTDGAAGAKVFLSNVYIEPNWPQWEGYDTTNFDGMVLDDSEEIFAEDVMVKNWNADSAADIKAKRAQLVCFRTEGDGNRTLRYWKPGPHYLVKSSLNNDTGDIVWLEQCEGAKIFVYQSTFNGQTQIPADKISCHHGSAPEIVYLTVDPRSTGEMHPMFSAR